MQILAGDAESFEKEDMERLICSMNQEEQTILEVRNLLQLIKISISIK